MTACFLSNISAKYYKNPSMLSRVIAKNVGDVFFETQCTCLACDISAIVHGLSCHLNPRLVIQTEQQTSCFAASKRHVFMLAKVVLVPYS